MLDIKNIKLKKVKTYIEDEYRIAYAKARKELGNNLILIDKKEIKQGGVFGFFGKKKIKVTYGLEETQDYIQKKEIKAGSNVELLQALKDAAKKTIENNTENNAEEKKTGIYSPFKKENFKSIDKIKEEISIKEVNNFKPLSETLKNNEKTESFTFIEKTDEPNLEDIKKEIQKELSRELRNEKTEFFNVDDETEEFIEKLRENDIPKDIAIEINNFFTEKGYSKKNFKEGLGEYFLQHIKTSENVLDKKFLMLVGPTGVGKTTSCAKIVANNWRNEKEVAFITADTYRLEAVSQIKAYANIMRVPVEVVKRPEDLIKAVEKFKDKDIVLMDTAGRSPKNTEQMNELKEYVENIGSEIEVVLVMSATSKLKVLYETIEKFKYIGFSSIIFTKIDETSSVGSILTIMKKYNIPISFITTGQTVPDDIEIATKGKLKEIFIEGIN
ncbi:flagellar biosynthesis protein FlhF [Hypnocyclicus thermotrophus]|uniref:Flagellar biosynthesis protein FlhF n=1 Tax=Hypnocyclicus thermotrophus TaxID=1627895 RepID=A0AA46DXJ9_9FUSO|nr:flagellar biosynthesis protein FlhF [Hypnocyclicus thermotrophus]TDT68564.1 flagellar biosynthesis protein FlhF [Hypnocyclicus thermotrophus]